MINGDGDRTAYSVVEAGTNQAFADTKQKHAPLSGYVTPTSPPSPRLVVLSAGAGLVGGQRRLLGLVGRHGHDDRLEHLGRVLLDVRARQQQASRTDEGDRHHDEEGRSVVLVERPATAAVTRGPPPSRTRPRPG